MNHYDVVIVGAGIGGLTCGARLSALGYKVGVFDQHYLPGGYATNFQRKGYTFDAALHGVGALGQGQGFYQILQASGVMRYIQPLPKEHPYSIRWKGEKFDIPQDAGAYLALLQRRFPEEREGIARLFDAIRRLSAEMKFLNDPGIAGWKKALGFLAKCPTLVQWSKLTAAQVIKRHVKSEEFMSFFTVLWPYYGLPPQRLSALYFFIPWLGYHLEGTYYIQGGAQALSDALVYVIEQNGGKVHLRQEVTEILIHEKKARGIRTQKGLEFTADWVVSNASPEHTLGPLIHHHPRAEKYRKRLVEHEIGPSLTQLYIGLSCPPEELGIVEEDLLLAEETDHQADYDNAIQGKYAAANLGLTNYNKMDPALNRSDRGVLAVTLIDDIGNWPERGEAYTRKKQEVTDILLQRLESCYPGIKERIALLELGTPRTMERYTKNPRGAVYGFAQTINQSGIKRTPRKTPFAGLSLVGAWTQPGGGFQGAATSGFLEAQRIHKQLQLRKNRG
ncbi:NAD(P)/FAD-dependent oxidoreductase [Paenibacillus macerans]|uniref:phytoene desaturase family protein n=1 Tax=Paenibacillus macerans TaxID=44252 RepID=UPI002E1CBDC8|nr:NAD(P)/FAD-dependent oxidoreductase [Paenibacillus macerans]